MFGWVTRLRNVNIQEDGKNHTKIYIGYLNHYLTPKTNTLEYTHTSKQTFKNNHLHVHGS